jgi:tetratricopeptide (TPR) repeat protein
VKPEEWFRRTEWNSEIERDFDARLRRSRAASNKAQYLRIQGLTLIMIGNPDLIRAGIRLTERTLAEYPDNRVQVSQCLHTLGNAHERLGATQEAIIYYRKAWAFEREFPNAISGARLDLAMLIVRLNRRENADEALAAIDPANSASVDLWPIIVMRKSLVRATIASWRGNSMVAAEHAREGLRAASLTQSFARNHPTLGLVGKESESEIAALKQLAGERHVAPPPGPVQTMDTKKPGWKFWQ